MAARNGVGIEDTPLSDGVTLRTIDSAGRIDEEIWWKEQHKIPLSDIEQDGSPHEYVEQIYYSQLRRLTRNQEPDFADLSLNISYHLTEPDNGQLPPLQLSLQPNYTAGEISVNEYDGVNLEVSVLGGIPPITASYNVNGGLEFVFVSPAAINAIESQTQPMEEPAEGDSGFTTPSQDFETLLRNLKDKEDEDIPGMEDTYMLYDFRDYRSKGCVYIYSIGPRQNPLIFNSELHIYGNMVTSNLKDKQPVVLSKKVPMQTQIGGTVVSAKVNRTGKGAVFSALPAGKQPNIFNTNLLQVHIPLNLDAHWLFASYNLFDILKERYGQEIDSDINGIVQNLRIKLEDFSFRCKTHSHGVVDFSMYE